MSAREQAIEAMRAAWQQNQRTSDSWRDYDECIAGLLDAAHEQGHIYWADEIHDDCEHVIEFTEDNWTIQHPLAERLNGSLFGCHWNERCQDLDGPPSEGPGRYIATLEAEVPVFRRVDVR